LVWTCGSSFTVIHGDAVGADRVAGYIARKVLGLPVEVFPADWNRYGRRAGYLRNVEMADQKPDCVVAFMKDDSKGTSMMLKIAEDRGLDVLVFTDPQTLPRVVA
jgi:hypothetical protein